MNQDTPIIGCIVVDDEPLALGILAEYIQKVPFLKLLGTYSDPVMALNAMQQQVVHCIVLDIQMPALNGLQLATMLSPDCKVIFTTAHPNYAVQGFELNATDYLLKPVSFERFLKAVNRVLNLLHAKPVLTGTSGEGLVDTNEVLFVKNDYKIVKVLVSDILYIEGLKEYITIYTSDKKIITLQNMKKMEAVLPAGRFVRVHRSYIVALDKIDHISKNRIFIRQTVIPVGDTYKESFFLLVNNKNLF
ncbi:MULTISPECIES: LytR/AlgR family response regulator transcription factor [Niastella]|uniref:Response regulator transcription factor n=1 Tax=Niastella soli TaxID=2821487 RepID=A0ABS3Z137_9BACT|nr:LytTR family DNA-binding domain-containing protein [Niastella soli]MBO9203867.1 response regulator transcription factor [Niastella soli]